MTRRRSVGAKMNRDAKPAQRAWIIRSLLKCFNRVHARETVFLIIDGKFYFILRKAIVWRIKKLT
jgi:hypothetical protein